MWKEAGTDGIIVRDKRSHTPASDPMVKQLNLYEQFLAEGSYWINKDG